MRQLADNDRSFEPGLGHQAVTMVKRTVDNYHHSVTPREQRIYDHLLDCVAHESPEELLERFYALFIQGTGYPDRAVVAALDDVLASPEMDEHFRYVLNRSCHILINRWQTNLQHQPFIPDLVHLFEKDPERRMRELSRGRSVRRLRQVVGEFRDTEQYLALLRLARVLESAHSAAAAEATKPLGNLINRYPYLYGHCLVTEDSDLEHQRHVRHMQTIAQKKFEVDLSQYVTYRVRVTRLRKQGKLKTVQQLRSIPNPTLLSDSDLVVSLRQFATHRDGSPSYRDGADRFMAQMRAGQPSFGGFKQNLYDYIVADVASSYGQRQFNTLLADHLSHAYASSDDASLNDFLLVRTCSSLLTFLVVDPKVDREHFMFLDLISNLGVPNTVGLLMKVLLLCRKVRPYLERRFSLLFNHYESASRDSVDWLVTVLENLNIALSLNFGTVDLSYAMAKH